MPTKAKDNDFIYKEYADTIPCKCKGEAHVVKTVKRKHDVELMDEEYRQFYIDEHI